MAKSKSKKSESKNKGSNKAKEEVKTENKAAEPKKEESKQEESKQKPKKDVDFSVIDTQEKADKYAKKYIKDKDDPRRYLEMQNSSGEDVKIDRCSVMYVTKDANVFYADKQGEAYAHKDRVGGKVFKVTTD